MHIDNMPDRIRRRPIDARGYPIPWFVEYINGKPDFRVIDGRKLVRAVKEKRCWICGERLGAYLAFTIGPMCALNRTISEPPAHRECADFSARVCPFLSLPKKTRDEEAMPADAVEAAGIGLKRNPGAVCVWITKGYALMRVANGILFRIGDPFEVHWYAHGRSATRAEVLESLDSGLPLLRAEEEGPDAIKELRKRYDDVVTNLLPA